MSTFLLTSLLFTQRALSRHSHSESQDIALTLHGSCDDLFKIFKYTMATTNADNTCENMYRIFPDIHESTVISSGNSGSEDEDASFCGGKCNLELPDTCFQLHATETTAYDDGFLPIDDFENVMDSKWEHALQSKEYDAFFDYNMAFWVRSLDDFISHWQSVSHRHSEDLQYFGIEWTFPSTLDVDIDSTSTPFYSILVHSKQSQMQYEFMSFSRPQLYDDIEWITDDVPRCTFGALDGSHEGSSNIFVSL